MNNEDLTAPSSRKFPRFINAKEELSTVKKCVRMLFFSVFLFWTFLSIFFLECIDGASLYNYKIMNIYPHDSNAFTQGLIYSNGYFFEGIGLYRQSALRKVEVKTGKIIKEYRLPSQYFGEGIAMWNDRLIQLTWREKKGFVYEKDTFSLIRKFFYDTEGWGITQDGNFLIMSDGSANLYFLNPKTFQQVKKIKVRDRDKAIKGLNELEYVRGKVYANVWPTDRIAVINPETGLVDGWLNLTGLRSHLDSPSKADVLNGIAYDAVRDKFFVTGKFWPKVFEIRITP
ncbi:MAG: glutaminyl-peptide cyclotransferase [Nitrospirota bacterium]